MGMTPPAPKTGTKLGLHKCQHAWSELIHNSRIGEPWNRSLRSAALGPCGTSAPSTNWARSLAIDCLLHRTVSFSVRSDSRSGLYSTCRSLGFRVSGLRFWFGFEVRIQGLGPSPG